MGQPLLPAGIQGQVRAIAVSAQTLYAGGAFTNVAIGLSNVACWNGANWAALDSGVNGPVYALAVSGSNLYVGGKFSVAGGLTASNVARWNGSRWSALGVGGGGVVSSTVRVRPPPVSALLALGDDVYVGGSFKFAGGKPASDFTLWHLWVALQITRAGDAIRLSWPAAADDYGLRVTATCSPVFWQTVTNPPALSGSQWSVTLSNTGPGQFYRLQKP